jgi:hypothetical protein
VEFAAVLAKIQGWLNNRAICLKSDLIEVAVITPKQLHSGPNAETFPEPALAWHIPSVRNRIGEMLEVPLKFWNLWSTSYLESLENLLSALKC